MTDQGVPRLPKWLFAILAVGGLLASGIYLGMTRLEGASEGNVVRAIVFGVFGLLMFWGAMSKHK
jgi:hypothetical protein